MLLLAMTLATASAAVANAGSLSAPQLSYELTVEPQQPRVGDSVRLTFNVGAGARGGLPQYSLLVDGGELSGDLGPVDHVAAFPDAVSFTLDAVSAGVAEVRLRVNYEGAFTVGGECCVFHFVLDVSPTFRIPVSAGEDPCDQPLSLQPESGLPGSAVTIAGGCLESVSSFQASLLFGEVPLVAPGDNSAGDFVAVFTVPWLPPGTYEVRAGAGASRFAVTGDFPGCDGDCNGDLNVRIGELTRAVGIALGTIASSTCPVFRDGASVAQLVRAVRAALDGCAELFPALPVPTPVETKRRCDQCCADCSSVECVAQCVGRDACALVSEWSGVIRDATTGAPIAGATLTLNGTAVHSDEQGAYILTSIRDEVCSGLDYLYALTVTATGYESLSDSLYRVPYIGPVVRDIELVAQGSS
jgi:hypothetical protein